MRISWNINISEEISGGVNQFFKILTKHLKQSGHNIVSTLGKSNVDLILMTHACGNISSYGINEIRSYIKSHANTLFVHRINVCDEHLGYGNEDEKIIEINRDANYTVFISSFLRDLYIDKGFDPKRPHSIILNGADEKVFNPVGRAGWKPNRKLKIITHHWSAEYTKGFDIYERLDQLLGTKPFSNLFEFTFIGNIPKGLRFKNTRVIQPLPALRLVETIKQHHIYITGTRNEAAGMHHIEGMCCGLPVLYLNSGALPEYCSSYGVEFSLINFEKRLLKIRTLYPVLRQKVLEVPYSGSSMANRYQSLFSLLVTGECQVESKVEQKD